MSEFGTNKKESLRNFIVTNHDVVMDYHRRYYNRLTSLSKTKYASVRLLFLNSLESSGGPVSIKSKRTCLDNFLNKIKSLEDKTPLYFKSFAECFMDEFKSPVQIKILTEILQDDSSLPHFGKKKSRLFIKELILLGGRHIFHDMAEKDYLPHLSIPIDKVIRRVYCRLNDYIITNMDKYDDEIEIFAEDLFPDKPIFLDDLWFWGHFTSIKDGMNSEPNEDLIYINNIMDKEFISIHDLRYRLHGFIEILNNGR